MDLNTLPLPDLFRALAGEPGDFSSPLARVLDLAYDEDLGPIGDVTSEACFGSAPGPITEARLAAREPMRISGLACLPALVDTFSTSRVIELAAQARDGDTAAKDQTLATLRGPLTDILALERTTLNLVSRLCGVATLASEFVAATEGVRARIYDTRKTTPGLRLLEKYAVRCGGAFCHRIGLYDAVLIKDNHIAHVPPRDLPAFVRAAANKARTLAESRRQALQFIELEVDSLDQFRAILDAGGCGVTIVLLDNMAPDLLRRAVEMRDASGLTIELEASGGVLLSTVRAIAGTGVERISTGAITHQAVSRDIGLDIG